MSRSLSVSLSFTFCLYFGLGRAPLTRTHRGPLIPPDRRRPFLKPSPVVPHLSTGSNVQYELVSLPGQIYRLGGRTSNATHELVFVASEVSPLGLVNYHVERVAELETAPKPPEPHNSTEDVIIDNRVRSYPTA